VQDAKNWFSEVVEAARRRPQTVTKRGKPAVVILSADEYDRLRKLEHLKAPSFAGLSSPCPPTTRNSALEGRMREPVSDLRRSVPGQRLPSRPRVGEAH
jgi:prevent-host-death family protein